MTRSSAVDTEKNLEEETVENDKDLEKFQCGAREGAVQGQREKSQTQRKPETLAHSNL